MFGSKSLSVYLFYITKLLSILIGLLLVFIVFSFVIGNYELNQGRFAIYIPYSEIAIKGFYKFNIIATIIIILFFYTVFFYLLSSIFNTFKAETLFTEIALKRLNYFAILNLAIVPFFYLLIRFIIMQKDTYRNLPLVVLHMVLGIFILFIISIFKRGYKVQSEIDLTI